MKPLIIILSIFALSACDPIRHINFKHQSSKPATIVIKHADGMYWCGTRLDKTTTVITLDHTQKDQTCLMGGIGTWTDDAIKQIASNTHSITITTNKGVQTYDTPDEIYQWLHQNKSWRWDKQHRIQIKVK